MSPLNSSTKRGAGPPTARLLWAACLLLAFLAVVASAQTKPPASFADWLRKSDATYGPTPSRAASACLELHGDDDAKVGACFVARLLPRIRQARIAWERAMTRLPTWQPPICRHALRDYTRTARHLYDVMLAFFRSHRNTPLTTIAARLRRQPYAHLRATASHAEARAIHACP